METSPAVFSISRMEGGETGHLGFSHVRLMFLINSSDLTILPKGPRTNYHVSQLGFLLL